VAYANAQDLTDRYDSRLVAQYAKDGTTPATPASLATNRRLLAALRDASAQIDASVGRGGRYTREVLAALAADPDLGGLLIRMTCALAFAQLIGNRAVGIEDMDRLVHGYKEALQNLDDLENGKYVFPIAANLEASLPSVSEGPDNTDPNRPTNWNPMFGRWGNRGIY
jgi:phage gp36-like protein